MTFASCLYQGKVTHRRVRPKRHSLGYRVFYLLVDLDELDALDRGTRLFAHNGFGLLSFHDADHLDGSDAPLRDRVERLLRAAGLDHPGGAIRLLCMPRLLGYAFNPLSIYFCHDDGGRLVCLIYEVNNTFGQRHSYVIPVDGGDGVVRQSCAKRFYVSPFLDMDLTYDFHIGPPGEAVTIGVTVRDADGAVLTTGFSGTRRAITDRSLLGAFLGHPLMTLKVVVGIHWEALRIWLKGIKLRTRPRAPEEAVTMVSARAD